SHRAWRYKPERESPTTGGACRGSCGNPVSRPRSRSTDVPVVSSPQLHQSVLPRVRACLPGNLSRGSKRLGVDLRLMGFERCKVGRPSGIRHGLSWENMPPGRSPMRQDNTSTLSGLASFAKLQGLLTARRHEGCAEAKMTFEAFEVELGHAVRGLENELKAADLARYEVDTE